MEQVHNGICELGPFYDCREDKEVIVNGIDKWYSTEPRQNTAKQELFL